MTSNTQINNFKRKVFCMNSNPPVEVSQLDHALLDLSVKLKPNERTLAKHRSYAQTVRLILSAHFTRNLVTNSAYELKSVSHFCDLVLCS